MLENFMIGVVTKDRYNGLEVLLKSLTSVLAHTIVIDASDNNKHNKIINKFNTLSGYYFNVPTHRKAVVHNKNLLMHIFLQSKYDNLFIIEDDVKVLDCDIFNKYIKASEKYNIPHMNYGGNDNSFYNVNKDIRVGEHCMGIFCFYTRKCLENVGLMNHKLEHNCWEHIEHTAKIHQVYNYQPSFNHYPDITYSYESIVMQHLPSVIGNTSNTNYYNKDKQVMIDSLGWEGLPMVSIKRFDPVTIKTL